MSGKTETGPGTQKILWPERDTRAPSHPVTGLARSNLRVVPSPTPKDPPGDPATEGV